ncbi:YcdB/YcdC domain-containing protein [Oceanobacillus halotolerans]|uniref:YcdB/YcdC domain-containing protein n=1 Tax=Oceanobacillus halotolerans TaxID=2663380 RepID=UPI0013DA202F|nr:YcdB/YcdC domain-containing protein [Oceanobacillus halotolerans]
MLKEELKKRAISMVQIPSHFHSIIEEYVERENGEGEAMFSWTNEAQDEGVTINLDFSGNLTSLSIDNNDENLDVIPLNIETKRERAEQFLLRHYPDALKYLTYYKAKKLTRTDRFYYEQIVMDLPLGNAGCYIDIDHVGSIVKFTYQGVKQIPDIPTTLIPKEKLVEHVRNRLNFQLGTTNLYTAIHDVAADGLRLVYEPDQFFMKYKADVLKPTLTIIHDEDEPQTYVSLTPPSTTNVRKDLSIEDIVGITDRMEVIREVDMGEETGIVWRDQDWEMKERDLSINGFFKRQSEDTVKAFISKKTGKVRSFMWFNERSGDLRLSREACYQKAIAFLQMIVPNYYQYLQLIVQENEEEVDDTSKKEAFTFNMHNGHGIPIHLELVIVVVNRQTGQVDHYSGPSFDMEQLSQLPIEPAISKKEASEIFINHLDFELAWNKNYDSKTESYILVYQACDRHSRTPIRSIDAMTGAVISNKDK